MLISTGYSVKLATLQIMLIIIVDGFKSIYKWVDKKKSGM
jgi:hypothetical protein